MPFSYAFNNISPWNKKMNDADAQVNIDWNELIDWNSLKVKKIHETLKKETRSSNDERCNIQ